MNTRPFGQYSLFANWTTGDSLDDLEGNDSSSAQNESVSEQVDICSNQAVQYFIHTSFLVSIIITIIMGFLNRRHHFKTDCCGGKPGLAIPINLLDDYDNRWSYACSFGALTNTIVYLFLGPEYFGFPAPQVAKVFIGMATALEVCIIFYPFFACINTQYVTAGSLIGFAYSAVWLSASISHLTQCSKDPIPEVLPDAGLVLSLPNIVCLGAILIRFLVNIIRACKNKKHITQDFKKDLAETWQINYVKHRINYKEKCEDEKKKRCSKISEFIKKYVYEKEPNFKYSSRIICTLFVVICCTYQLGLLYMLANAYFVQWAVGQVDQFVDVTGFPRNSTLIENLYVSVNMLRIAWQVATGVSLALFVINVVLIVLKYRRDVLRLFHGDKHHFPKSVLQQTSSDVVRNCILFAGFQIAYMIWGYLVLNFVLWIVALLFCFVIILPLLNGITTVVVFFLNFCIIPLFVSIILRFIQTVMSRVFFLQDKVDKDDKEKPLALNNRRAFHLANYIFFMANIETGLFSSLYRILQGLIFGLIFLGRLDRCVLMSGLESQDKGYNAYIGMLFMEHMHNNPVLRVFCDLVSKDAERKRETETSKNDDDDESGKETHVNEIEVMEEGVDCNHRNETREESENSRRDKETYNSSSCDDDADVVVVEHLSGASRLSKRKRSTTVQHRWHLIYTLVNNPQLILLRRRGEDVIDTEANEDSKSRDDFDSCINACVRYEQHRKLKEAIRVIEDQIFGPIAERRLESVACQINEADLHDDDSAEITSDNAGTSSNAEDKRRLIRCELKPDDIVTVHESNYTSTSL